MEYATSLGPVVVGIDGSAAAINAGRWAIREAATRCAARLVYAVFLPSRTRNLRER